MSGRASLRRGRSELDFGQCAGPRLFGEPSGGGGGEPVIAVELQLCRGRQLAVAPEPSTWAMMLIGFGGLGYVAPRRVTRARVALS